MVAPFDFLKTTNDWLETVPENTTKAFENMINSGEAITQSKVDDICVWLSWKVNIAIERKRQAVLRILYGMYQGTVAGKVMSAAMAIKTFFSNPLKKIGSVASVLYGPIPAVISWIKMLMVEIPRLAENLANIASSLPPPTPEPYINYDKFKLKVGTISLATITTDPSSLPPPEVMFPEPSKPFSKETFTKTFELASANLKSAKRKFTLRKEDKAAIESLNNGMT